MIQKTKSQHFFVIIPAILSLFLGFAQFPAIAQAVVESGKFRLHKFQQPIGEETYQVSRDGTSLLVKSDFKFTDRGSPVPLTTTLKTDQNLNPLNYTIKGSTARGSTIDDDIAINANSASIREGTETR